MELVAGVTVQFEVVSKVVRVVREEVLRRVGGVSVGSGGGRAYEGGLRALAKSIDLLQERERERLRVTAALHLSVVRLCESKGVGDERTRGLVEDEVRRGEEKLRELEEECEEAKEEVREGLLVEDEGVYEDVEREANQIK